MLAEGTAAENGARPLFAGLMQAHPLGPGRNAAGIAALERELASAREALEQQCRKADDLRAILCSTDVATLFLDRGMNIRFFTPAIRALFNVILSRPALDCPLSTTLLMTLIVG